VIHDNLISELEQDSELLLKQAQPFPVVAPRTKNAVARAVELARRFEYGVLPLGTGSSFAADYMVTREKTIALMCGSLSVIEQTSSSLIHVLAGTSLSKLITGAPLSKHRTLGGLICGSRGLTEDAALKILWPRIQSLFILGNEGAAKALKTDISADNHDRACANLMIGSKGHFGILVACDFVSPLPVIPMGVLTESRAEHGDNRGLAVMESDELTRMMDPQGLFRW
jgi:hypothetical protein